MEDQNLNVKIIPPRDYLPKLAAAVAGLLSLFLLVLVVGGIVEINNKIKEGRYIGQAGEYKNTINVSGEGKILAKPDIGQVDLSVLSRATTVAAAQKDNTEKMNKITQALKDLGVKEEDLKTVNYSVNPTYQYTAGRSVIIGYEVNQTLRAKIRDLAKVSVVLDRAAALGANQVGSLNFTFDEPEKLKDEARQKAIADAKAKAKELAGGLDIRLGKIVSFSESSYDGTQPIYYGAKEGYGVGGGGAAPDVQAGQNEIIINVNLAYEIY